MTHLSRAFVLALSMFFAVGCAKTDQQKKEEAVSSANSEIASYNASLHAIDALGTPSASWTTQQLDAYQTAIETVETKIQRVRGAYGKDGVYIIETYKLDLASRLMTTARGNLAAARAAKARAEAQSVAAKTREERVAALKQKISADNQYAIDNPLHSKSTVEEVADYESRTKQRIQDLREYQSLLEDADEIRRAGKMEANLEKDLVTIAERRKLEPNAEPQI